MRSANAIILVGGSGPSLLRSSFGMPICLVPMPHASSLLAAWIELIERIEWISRITVVTGRRDDLDMIRAELDRLPRRDDCSLRAIADRNEHRGTAGCVADALDGDGSEGEVLIVEGASAPPRDIDPILDERMIGDDASGIILRTPTAEPAGVILLRKKVLDLVPRVGFFDLKEQLMQRVVSEGGRILVRPIGSSLRRITSPNDYINMVSECSGRRTGGARGGPWIHETAQVDPSAIITETALVGRDAQIGQNAVVDQSIVLEGSQVGSGALIARSVIRSRSQIPPRTRIVESMDIGLDSRWNPRAAASSGRTIGDTESTRGGRS